jgi:hypothetical protein
MPEREANRIMAGHMLHFEMLRVTVGAAEQRTFIISIH